VTSVLDAGGRVAAIVSTARGDHAGAIAPGSPARRLRGHARGLGAGLWVGRKLRGGASYVYGTRAGHVRFIALVSSAGVRSRARLRSDLRAGGV
jgi:hypothetical protein